MPFLSISTTHLNSDGTVVRNDIRNQPFSHIRGTVCHQINAGLRFTNGTANYIPRNSLSVSVFIVFSWIVALSTYIRDGHAGSSSQSENPSGNCVINIRIIGIGGLSDLKGVFKIFSELMLSRHSEEVQIRSPLILAVNYACPHPLRHWRSAVWHMITAMCGFRLRSSGGKCINNWREGERAGKNHRRKSTTPPLSQVVHEAP